MRTVLFVPFRYKSKGYIIYVTVLVQMVVIVFISITITQIFTCIVDILFYQYLRKLYIYYLLCYMINTYSKSIFDCIKSWKNIQWRHYLQGQSRSNCMRNKGCVLMSIMWWELTSQQHVSIFLLLITITSIIIIINIIITIINYLAVE